MPTALEYKTPITIDRVAKHGVAKVLVTHEDLTEEDGSQTLDWSTIATALREQDVPSNARLMWAYHNLLEEFAGGAVSAATLSLGDAGTANELINAQSIFTGAGAGIKAPNGSYTLGTFEAAYDAKITIATTDGNVADLTAGKLELFIEYIAYPTASLLQ